MALDGRILAKARDELETIRARSAAEDERRHAQVYERVPALKKLDADIAALMLEVVRHAAGGGGRSLAEVQEESLRLQQERSERLVENGYPIDWLDGAWQCSLCRDTGYVDGEMCRCLKKLYEKHRAEDLSALLGLGQESFAGFDLRYYSDRADPATGVSDREVMQTVYEICRGYALGFGKGSPNLLFAGGTGLGKTFLSASIARVVSEKGHSVVYDTAVAALAAFETQKFTRSAEEAEHAAVRVRQLLGCELLIMDDLGTEMATEFTRSALYTLVNSRLLSGGRTIISTNLSHKEMEKRYTPQILSRLDGEYQLLRFVGTDIRQIKKQRGLE